MASYYGMNETEVNKIIESINEPIIEEPYERPNEETCNEPREESYETIENNNDVLEEPHKDSTRPNEIYFKVSFSGTMNLNAAYVALNTIGLIGLIMYALSKSA